MRYVILIQVNLYLDDAYDTIRREIHDYISVVCLNTHLYGALLLKFFSNVEVILSSSIVLSNVDIFSANFFSTCSLFI